MKSLLEKIKVSSLENDYTDFIKMYRNDAFIDIDPIDCFNILKDHRNEQLIEIKLNLFEDIGHLNHKHNEEQGVLLYDEEVFIDLVNSLLDDFQHFENERIKSGIDYKENTDMLIDHITLLHSFRYWSEFDITEYSKIFFPEIDKIINSNIPDDIINNYVYRSKTCFDYKLLNMYKLDIIDQYTDEELRQAAIDHQLDFFQLQKMFDYKSVVFDDEQFLYDIFNDFSYEINNSDCILKVVKLETAFKEIISDMSNKLNSDIFKILESVEHISDLYQDEKLAFELNNF